MVTKPKLIQQSKKSEGILIFSFDDRGIILNETNFEARRMKNTLISFSLLVCAGVFSVSACAHEPVPEQDHISVVGVGEIEQEPDQAIVNVSINAKQPTLPEAKKVADEKYRSVLAVLKKMAIDKKHIKATRISAQPEYEWSNNKQIYKGERVSRSLAITVNDLEKVSPLMQALVENGVSTIDGMNTGFKDPKALQEKAMAAAADDAKAKAKFLAERLGRNLGSAYLISEHNNSQPLVRRPQPSMMARSMSAEQAPPPEMFGTQKVSATVNVSFNLL